MKTYPKFIHKSSMTESSIFGFEVTKWLRAQLALLGITTAEVCCDSETTPTIDTQIAALRTQEGTYTEYRVLVSQTSTDDPTAVVLNNTLGGTPTFEYTSDGLYKLTNTGKFTVSKTEVSLSASVADTSVYAIRTSADVITFGSAVANTGVATNAKLTTSLFVVKVWA